MTPEEELAELRSFIIGTIPYLEEAWKACFHGEEKAMLSAEERGMGFLLNQFRRVAAGMRTIPADTITTKACQDRVDAHVEWAHRLLGHPNDLHPDLQDWMDAGETCADGLKKANAEVVRLRALLRAMGAT